MTLSLPAIPTNDISTSTLTLFYHLHLFQSDGRQCASGPTNSLIFAHREDIRQISLDVPYTVDVVLPLPQLKSARAVDADRKTGKD